MNAEELLRNILGKNSRVINVVDHMTFEDFHDFPLISVDVGIWDVVIVGGKCV